MGGFSPQCSASPLDISVCQIHGSLFQLNYRTFKVRLITDMQFLESSVQASSLLIAGYRKQLRVCCMCQAEHAHLGSYGAGQLRVLAKAIIYHIVIPFTYENVSHETVSLRCLPPSASVHDQGQRLSSPWTRPLQSSFSRMRSSGPLPLSYIRPSIQPRAGTLFELIEKIVPMQS